MKRKIKFLAMAAAALTFAACSEELVPTPEQARNEAPESNAISFSTYMGRTGMTRAGATGSIDTDKLKESDYGFGVFAYYTGTYTYGQYQAKTYSNETGKNGSKDKIANFMFNQQVTWDDTKSSNYITKWSYSPIKYWPNEVDASENHDVDDQNKDTSNDPALGSGTYGGNVSFFAYAPYVEMQNDHALAGDGITRINGKGTLPGANAQSGDPILTYKLPAVATTKAVDLLWGTTGLNGTGVAGAANSGVQGDGDVDTDMGGSSEAKKYAESILGSYRTNADLTKQTTSGTVDFAFKHALAKIGGSYVGNGEGDDEDGTTSTNGLMVILDLDDFKGGESGGSLESYLAETLEDGSKPEWNKYNSKVTIDELIIKYNKDLKIPDGKTIDDLSSLDFDLTQWSQNPIQQGDFNLATGQWSNFTSGEIDYVQTLLPSGANVGDDADADDSKKDAVLSEELAEPTTAPDKTKAGFESLPIGVTTVAKNVYETEANPLVFIPGSMPILEFTITYTVRTYDPNLKDSYTEVKQKIKKNLYITEAIDLNKQYNILMHLGLTSVKFTATVTDWETTDATGTTIEPTNGGSPVTIYEDEVEHVYLPINVGEPESVTATLALEGTVAALNSGAYEIGSKAGNGASTAFLNITGMEATFSDGEKDVEMTHVTIQALDDNNQSVDWISWQYDTANDKIVVSVTNNETVDDRTAKLRIIYNNVADEYDIKQYGRIVQNFTVNVYNDAAQTTAHSGNYASGVTKYYPTITPTYQEATNTGAGDGTDVAMSAITEGFTITAGDYTTVSGTTFSTKQYMTTVYNPEERAEDTNKLTFTYDGISTVVAVTQDAPVVDEVELTINRAASQTYSASTTTTGDIKVLAKFKDSNNEFAGEGVIPNSVLKNAAAANTWAITSRETWATYADGADTLTLEANTADGAVDRTATITADYNNGTKTGTATITQKKP